MNEYFRRLFIQVKAALISGMDTFFVGKKYLHFRKTCERISRGESISAVRDRLQATGSRYWQTDGIHQWQRTRGLTFKLGVCTVEVDDEDMVQTSRFEEVDDLM